MSSWKNKGLKNKGLPADLAAGMAAASPGNALAEGRAATEAANVKTVLRMFAEGWGANEGWETVWRENLSPGFLSYFHSRPPIEGIEPAIAFNRELFVGFPELRMTVEDVVAEGDNVIVRGRLSGSNDGPFLGAPPSGADVLVPDVTIFRLEGGKIVEMRYFTDLLAVMTTIGAVHMGG